jgi:sarcosine oxidase, subunit gamma
MGDSAAPGELATRRTPEVSASEWLRALPPAARFAFYGGAKARTAALPVWGVEFSEQACRAKHQGTRSTLWLGPDEYLLLDFGDGEWRSDPSAQDQAIDALEFALAGVPHALVDISHRQFTLEVSGPHAATILSGACPLDLDLSEFPVGMCTRTVLAKADIVLWRTHPDVFHLEVWRSFAGYVTGILTEIAREFYPA